MHARDFFSLQLTAYDNTKKKDSSEATKTLLLEHAAALRRRPSPAILPRGKKILVCFGYIRAVISRDHGVIFETHDHLVHAFINVLAKTLQYKYEETMRFPDVDAVLKAPYVGDEPFELVFLEEILREVCDTWNTRIQFFNAIVGSVVGATTETGKFYGNVIDSGSIIHQLALLNDSLCAFEMDIKQALDCLTDLLNNDDDMLRLLLTESSVARRKKTHVDPMRHDIAELLLEDYSRQLATLLEQINYLKSRVRGQQELMSLSIDGYRNLIIQMDLSLTVVSVALCTSTAIAGLFGMNLISGFENSTSAFYIVAAGSAVSSMFVCAVCFHYVSGKRWKREATKRQGQLADLKDALSDVCAFDEILKSISRGEEFNKETFTERLNKCRLDSPVSSEAADCIFELLDTTKDGVLRNQDFTEIQSLILARKESPNDDVAVKVPLTHSD
eukprot:CAMPEP_0172420046 /NCGR_PEP_ID=MMETSP1064-20121228/6427_1 /TAXON_ID=202472 /ORGANISM="Aulacoseira subarctica , Strain CCAP 1002/5" /LENGTH=444 /DNA_ID=CAMNT_0013159801 /DNA_START=408 /DNA_END=1742 /DNA_ORIENTATION=+